MIALVYICAFASRLAGLEPAIGAFVAGLLLNRFIPESGVLMNRVKFAGDALFVPFLMVYIGVLADPVAALGSLGVLARNEPTGRACARRPRRSPQFIITTAIREGL